MSAEAVHTTQETYRKLLDSMSRPGKISVLKGNMEHWIPCHHATYLTALTLFDAEVSFHVVGDANDLAIVLSELTFAKHVPAEDADYIIIPLETEEAEVFAAMKKCRIGNLVNPQTSATLLVEQDRISNDKKIVLTGPGIKERTYLDVDVSEKFWEKREEEIKEYPLGIDLIFTDCDAKLACIPRTTNVHRKGRGM